MLYLVGPKTSDFQRSKIENMPAMNVMEPAKTERASPVIFALKEDGPFRICDNYRQLNAVTIRDSCLVP